uniref:Uncharacterized protein n=1 Tax=Borely moumouvirus TaxID=2712067 RepID=A0A6G6AAN7_9VIRU
MNSLNNSTEKRTLFSILNGNKNKSQVNKSCNNTIPIVSENNYVTNSTNQTNSNNDRRSFINLNNNNTIPGRKSYDKNSLACICEIIRQKVTERCTLNNKFLDTSDQVILERVQKKFEEKKNDWNLMMDFILKHMIILDEKFIQYNHLDVKDLIRDQISNISFSYIILEDSNTFKQNIINFIKSLDIFMSEIHQCKVKLSKLNLQTSKHQNIKKDNLKNITLAEQKIKSSNISHNETIINKKNIETYKKIIEETESMLKSFDKNKEIFNQTILDNIYFINTNLKFNTVSSYFMHDDWIPYLDNNIFPSGRNII